MELVLAGGFHTSHSGPEVGRRRSRWGKARRKNVCRSYLIGNESVVSRRDG